MAAPDISGEIASAPELSPARLADLTSRFVAVPSVNGEHGEAELARLIRDELETAGFLTSLIGDEGRPSLGARFGGEPRLVLNGHTDTVPVDDAEQWRFDPFAGVVAEGAVHGRGACDMKGGLAVQVAVAQWLAGIGRADGLVLHFAMGEERGEPGTEDLIDAGFVAPHGVVLEPTDLRLATAQRGLVTLRIEIEGRAGHASRPELTDNPVDRLGAVLASVRSLDSRPKTTHRLLGAPTWTTTMVHAGVIPSMVPASCLVHVDRRMVPGESVDEVISDLRDGLADAGVAGVEIDVAVEEGVYEPAEVRDDGPTASMLREALAACDEAVEIIGTPYSSDVRHLVNAAGVDAVTFGPGRPSELHARDEFIVIEDLARSARVIADFAVRISDGAP